MHYVLDVASSFLFLSVLTFIDRTKKVQAHCLVYSTHVMLLLVIHLSCTPIRTFRSTMPFLVLWFFCAIMSVVEPILLLLVFLLIYEAIS